MEIFSVRAIYPNIQIKFSIGCIRMWHEAQFFAPWTSAKCDYKLINFLFLKRACIWWKYLDADSTLPPPYTILYFMIIGIKYFIQLVTIKTSVFTQTPAPTSASTGRHIGKSAESPQKTEQQTEQQQLLEAEKCEFYKRYANSTC